MSKMLSFSNHTRADIFVGKIEELGIDLESLVVRIEDVDAGGGLVEKEIVVYSFISGDL